jgi:predicted RNase H-like HicB family nuclease
MRFRVVFLLTVILPALNNALMRQRYHTIIRPEHGRFVGWVEEIPGTITQGKSLGECRQRLREALEIMLQTHRHEARLGLSSRCIQESIELEVDDPAESSYPA